MFEKEAEEYGEKDLGGKYLSSVVAKDKLHAYKLGQYDGFITGAEVGYNKANEWHYVKDGDLPKIDNRIVLCVCSNGYINGKRNHILKLLTRKEFPLFQPVYAWKEIVLPEENE